MQKLAAVILAAGKSKRIKSKIPKVMHMLAGRPVITYPVNIAKSLKANPILVVVSPGQMELKSQVEGLGAKVVMQKRALGTGHAVLQTQNALSKFDGLVLVLCGDVPLIRKETLTKFIKEVRDKNATCGVLTMELKTPGSYGRIIRDLDGQFIQIVEAKDAKDDELLTREVNSGVFCVEKKWLFEVLKKIKPQNSQNEYYLTDIIHHALNESKRIVAVKTADPQELLGINTRKELALLIAAMRDRINERHMQDGVGIVDPSQTYIDADVKIGKDTVIWPGTFIFGKTSIGSDCVIENGVVLRNVKVASHVLIKSYCVIEDSDISDQASVGPFTRLRPGTKLGKDVRVGNFVEVKKSELKRGVKANHLSYLGDSSIGAKTNVGCGTITCNYDGKNKYRTVIGEKTFIGSDVQFIAPVKIGSKATIGAGSTITKNVPPKSLALSRAEQVIVKNWAPKWKRSKKAK